MVCGHFGQSKPGWHSADQSESGWRSVIINMAAESKTRQGKFSTTVLTLPVSCQICLGTVSERVCLTFTIIYSWPFSMPYFGQKSYWICLTKESLPQFTSFFMNVNILWGRGTILHSFTTFHCNTLVIVKWVPFFFFLQNLKQEWLLLVLVCYCYWWCYC